MLYMERPKGRSTKSAPQAVTKMVRAWIREQEKAGRKPGEIAAELGVTRTQVVNVRDETRGVGAQMEAAFARLRFGGSVDALRGAAVGEPVDRPVVVQVFDDRYTSRGRAATAAQAMGYHPEAVGHVMSIRLDDDEDPGAEFWLDLMRSANQKMKKGIPL